MNLISMCVMVMVGFAVALPVENKLSSDLAELLKAMETQKTVGRNSLIENLLLDVIEDFRETMLTGTNAIPVLDPFILDGLSLDDQIIPVPGAKVEIKDIEVNNLSTFVINDLSVESTGNIFQLWYNLNLDGEIPELNLDAEYYDLSINIFGLNLFGSGDAKISIIKPRLKLYVQIAINLGLGTAYVTVRECEVAIDLTDIQFGLTGLFNDPSVDTFVNTFLRNLILELLNVFADDITQIVSPIVKDIANEFLKDFNIIDIIGS